jgi:hypothetical protein
VCGDCLCGAQTIRGVLHDARLSLDHTKLAPHKFFLNGVTQLISLTSSTAGDLSRIQQLPATELLLLLRAKWTVLKNHHETTALCERLGSSHS